MTVLLLGTFEERGSASEGLPVASGAEAVDRVVVTNSKRTLNLLARGKTVRRYKVALGGEPVGAKQQQGDHRTPEGQYVLDRRNANSRFYKSIHVSYPNEEDRKQAAQRGVDAGGDIMIHGLPNGFGWLEAMHREKDWTDGCIAVTDKEMDEIWDLVGAGTPIEIRP